MKTLLDLVKRIFIDYDDFASTTNGNTIIVRLDDDRRVKVSLYETWCHEQYDAIKLSLVSKTHGMIDQCVLKFKDVFESPQDMYHPNKISKHIWKTKNEYQWYGTPVWKDISALNTEIKNYISTWE